MRDLTGGDPRLYTSGTFFRRLRIVRRATLKVRAIPLWLMRSWSAATIWASLCPVMARLLGWGVKVLLHALQRQRAEPLRLVPKRLQRVLLQCGQVRGITTTTYNNNALKSNALQSKVSSLGLWILQGFVSWTMDFTGLLSR